MGRSGPSGPSGPSGRKPTSPRASGRPVKLTEDVIRALERAFARGATRHSACARAGITHQTFANWMIRAELGHGGVFAELRRRVRAAEAELREGLQGAIARAAADREAVYDPASGDLKLPGRRGDWRAAAAMLERLDRYGVLREDDADDDADRGGGPTIDVPDVIDAAELGPDATDAQVLEARERTTRRALAAASADGNHAAAASLARRLERTQDELRAMRRAAGGPAEADPAQLAEEELVWQITQAAEAMPEAHLRAVVDVYLTRHRMRLARDESAASGLLARSEDN